MSHPPGKAIRRAAEGNSDAGLISSFRLAHVFGVVLVVAVATSAGTSGPVQATEPTPCLYLEGSLVPALVIGVRRLDGTEIDSLPLRAEPSDDSPVVKELGLFRPYYVGERRIDPVRGDWIRLQDGYVAEPLGWVAAKHLEPSMSRYAYVFNGNTDALLADLHDSSKDAYDRLLAQSRGNPDGALDAVLVRRRLEPQPWNPSRIEDVVPFFERRRPHDPVDQDYPDTTPTFRFGIESENRLLHMGAVCGGPLDVGRLREMRQRINEDAGVEMLFVIDETASMKPYFEGVARFIGGVAGAVAGQPLGLKIAVSYYTDGPPGKRVTTKKLAVVRNVAEAKAIADEVAKHQDKLPSDDFANAPERMLEGLREAIKEAKFTKGSNAFVAVIGDTGHEPADPGKAKLIADVTSLIDAQQLHVFFAHVGKHATSAEMLFQQDASAVRDEAAATHGVPPERIVYQTADASTLQQALEDARQRADDVRRRTQRDIARMESRNRNTEPGPKFAGQLESAGIPKAAYDRDHLQYFVPARGWLHHPSAVSPAGDAAPQFQELFFLAPPEKAALESLLGSIQDRLTARRLPFDGTLIETFARSLSEASQQPSVRDLALALWRRIPERERSVGVYLENAFGLRIKSPLLYAIEATPTTQSSAAEIESLNQRLSRLRAVLRNDATRFWFETSSLMP